MCFTHVHGLNGSFYNDSFTMDTITSDYAYIERVRTMDKAVRGIRTYLLPHLSSPLYVDQRQENSAKEQSHFWRQLPTDSWRLWKKQKSCRDLKFSLIPTKTYW